MTSFTHLDKNQHPQIVDVSEKKPTLRTAVAQSTVVVPEKW
jgi:molybdenum cofactor biosynthesis enzyme